MAVINTHTYLDAVYIWGFRFLSIRKTRIILAGVEILQEIFV